MSPRRDAPLGPSSGSVAVRRLPARDRRPRPLVRLHAPLVCIVLLGLQLSDRAAADTPHVLRLGFEAAQPGKPPAGWVVVEEEGVEGYAASVTDERPHRGARSALLRLQDAPGVPRPGRLETEIDASPYRGTRVKLRAAVRTAKPIFWRAHLYMRAEHSEERPRWSTKTGPIHTNEWRVFELVGEVAEDARRIRVGVELRGTGTVWLDEVSLEIIGRRGEGDEEARPLAGAGLDNLVAFARLLGYVRYFHPSDEAASTDWDAFAARGVRFVEDAGSPGDLARKLRELFHPIAPAVRVYEAGRERPEVREIPETRAGSLDVVAWLHKGVGLGANLAYWSSRIDQHGGPLGEPPAGSGRRLAGVQALLLRAGLDPSLLVGTGVHGEILVPPLVGELGRGLACRVPLALHADEQGTLPRGAASRQPGLRDRPGGFVPSGNDRTTRLAAVVLAWNVLQHFYPYFDVVETDWPAALRHGLTSAASDTDEHAFLETLQRLVAQLADGHGGVVHGSESLRYTLPLLWEWIEEALVITHADSTIAGELQPGDVVVRIDGHPTREVIADQESRISAATPQFKRFIALYRMRSGFENSAVRLDVDGHRGGELTVRRTRKNFGPHKLKEPRPPKMHEIRPGIRYVDLSEITEEDFMRALPRLAEARGVLFDLRGYPRRCGPVFLRHMLGKASPDDDGMYHSAQWHIPIVTRPDRQDVRFVRSQWDMQPAQPQLTGKLVFMTDGRAISYAESVMGIIEHYGMAEIVGAPTAGTNGNVNPFVLPGSYEVRWTGMKVLKHDGSRHHGVGILPTVPATRTIRGVREGRDEVLERALEIVSGD